MYGKRENRMALGLSAAENTAYMKKYFKKKLLRIERKKKLS